MESFLAGATYKELVHELGRHTPHTTKELLDIATNFDSGDEAIGAIFQGRGKQLENPNDGGARRWFDKKKIGKKRPRDNLVAMANWNQARAPPPDGAGLFDKMLDESCPYHKGSVKHTLQECDMMKRFFTSIPAKGDAGKKPKDDKGDGKGSRFPIINNCFMIFGRPAAYDTKPTTPAYLDWSDATITFDHDDHPT
jgi:hypothetical protein